MSPAAVASRRYQDEEQVCLAGELAVDRRDAVPPPRSRREAGETHLEVEDVAREDLTAEPGPVDAAEEGQVPGEPVVREDHRRPELRQRLHHDHPRQGRASREVAGEEVLVAAKPPPPPPGLTWRERHDLREEEERRPVGDELGWRRRSSRTAGAHRRLRRAPLPPVGSAAGARSDGGAPCGGACWSSARFAPLLAGARRAEERSAAAVAPGATGAGSAAACSAAASPADLGSADGTGSADGEAVASVLRRRDAPALPVPAGRASERAMRRSASSLGVERREGEGPALAAAEHRSGSARRWRGESRERHVGSNVPAADDGAVRSEAVHLTLDQVAEAVLGDEGDERRRYVHRLVRCRGAATGASRLGAVARRLDDGDLSGGLGDRLLHLLARTGRVAQRGAAARPAHGGSRDEDPAHAGHERGAEQPPPLEEPGVLAVELLEGVVRQDGAVHLLRDLEQERVAAADRAGRRRHVLAAARPLLEARALGRVDAVREGGVDDHGDERVGELLAQRRDRLLELLQAGQGSPLGGEVRAVDDDVVRRHARAGTSRRTGAGGGRTRRPQRPSAPTASASRRSSSRAWMAWLPVAGLPASSRLTERSVAPAGASRRSRGSTKVRAPMLAGSSCSQTTSSARA